MKNHIAAINAAIDPLISEARAKRMPAIASGIAASKAKIVKHAEQVIAKAVTIDLHKTDGGVWR